MPSANDCWGIEIGANALKAIRLRRAGGDVQIADFEVIPHKELLTSSEADADETIRVALDQLLAKHDLRRTTNVVSVAGGAAFARFAKLPPVEPKQIPNIVAYEAVQQIPFPIEDVEWDYQTFADPDSPDVEVGIFAMTKDRLLPWLANIQSTGLPVHGVSLAPLAVFNALSYDLKLQETHGATIIMDIGTQSTDLIFYDSGRLWLRTFSIGGNRFTEALVRQFKLSFAKAEKLKREASSSKYARQIFQAMRPVFVDLVQEVQKSLGYYQSLNRDAQLERLVGLGSTFRLSGLQTFLKQQLQIDVHRLDSFKRIDVEGKSAATFADNALTLAPAYGLALQGLEEEDVSCNLLPAGVIKQQLWSTKQPWFIGAAAVSLIGAGLAAFSAFSAHASFESSENQSQRRATAAVLNDAKRVYNNWLDVGKQQNPTGRIENLIQMLEYRNVWPSVMRDLDEAVLAIEPQPAILEANAEAIKKIPRRDRRQIMIENVSVTYGPLVDQSNQSDGTWDTYKPAYTVRVEGTTPFRNPAELLESHLLNDLKEKADRPGRDYRIATDDDNKPAIALITKVKPPVNAGEKKPDGDSKKPATVEDLMPRPALADEPVTTDSRFVITWTIELRKPGERAQPPAAEDGDAAETASAAPAPTGEEVPR